MSTTTTNNNNNGGNSNNSNNSDSKKHNKKKQWVERDYNYYKNAPDKKDDPNYRDRAKERRKQDGGGEGEDEEDNNIPVPVKSGLDYSLLKQKQQQQQNDDDGKSVGGKKVTTVVQCKSILANSIYSVLSNMTMSGSGMDLVYQQQQQKNKEVFQKGRMIYVYDLDPNFPSLIPTTILNSKEDCLPTKQMVSGKLDHSLLKKVIECYNPDTKVNIIKEKNYKQQQQQHDSDDSDNENKQNNSLNVILPSKDDDDSGSDIFSDAEEYVCEPTVSSTTNKGTRIPINDNEEADKKFDYFSSSKVEDDMMKEFNPIGKEGDEKEDGGGSEDGEIEGPSMPKVIDHQSDDDNQNTGPQLPPQYNDNNDNDEDEDNVGPSIPSNYQMNNSDDQDQDEEAYPDTDMNYDRPSPPPQDEDEDDEYTYPNTENNYEQHEKQQKIEMEKRYESDNDDDDSDTDDKVLPILDSNNETLKRKLMQEDTYGDVIPAYQGFDRERGEKPKHTIDEMYKFKKEQKKKKPKTLASDIHNVNSILKKNYGDKYDLFKK